MKRVFAGQATAAHGGLVSGVEKEEGGTGPPALNAHAPAAVSLPSAQI